MRLKGYILSQFTKRTEDTFGFLDAMRHLKLRQNANCQPNTELSHPIYIWWENSGFYFVMELWLQT